jgi:hypothetical protein
MKPKATTTVPQIMKHLHWLLLLAGLAATAQDQHPTGTKKTLVPAGWTVVEEASGDLNQDGIDDAALVIEGPASNEEDEKPRALLVLLKDKGMNDLYTQASRSDKVILGSQLGGALGDPLANLVIEKGVLRIDFYGGSREKWSTTHRYWYKAADQSVYVIGATYTIEADTYQETYDYNISTGNIIITRQDNTKGAAKKVTNRMNKIMRPTLESFDPDAVWAILMPASLGVKTTSCLLQSIENSDCIHYFFDCGDFANPDLYLDEASHNLWYNLVVEKEPGDMKVNPYYHGKAFEITYLLKTGAGCYGSGERKVPLVIGFKLKN